MADSPELTAIRRRDAALIDLDDFKANADPIAAFTDRRTLLRMLDEALKERDEARAELKSAREGIVLFEYALLTVRTWLGLHRDSTDHLGEVAERMRAENERLREVMERGSDG